MDYISGYLLKTCFVRLKRMNPGDEKTTKAKMAAKRGEKIVFVQHLVSAGKLKTF